jgi:hypothetical protein
MLPATFIDAQPEAGGGIFQIHGNTRKRFDVTEFEVTGSSHPVHKQIVKRKGGRGGASQKEAIVCSS